MTVVAAYATLIDENDSAVKLARYAQLADYAEDQFFGINNPTTQQEACKEIWTLRMRKQLAKYLREAQDEIELVCGYPLIARWIVDEPHPYKNPIHAKYGKLIAAGIKGTGTISSGAAVVQTDPGVVTVATTVTDSSEIRVYHPGTDIEIVPSKITISGGNAVIEIPRARTVKLAFIDNDDAGIVYATLTNFESTVDVKRVYNDPSTQGGLVWLHRESAACDCDCIPCCGSCSNYTVTGCVTLRNIETGAFDVLPGAYTDGAWVADCTTCYCESPDRVHLNYKAGLTELTMQAEDAIIRLAHAKMPQPPCGCGTIQEMWTRDRNTPPVLTAERLNCPFGISDGAYIAWKFANSMRIQKSILI